MNQNNLTIVTEFLLLGFSFLSEVEFCIFILILIVYIFTIAANVLIIATVKVEPSLHKPMYFFISGFSFLEICYTSVTVPRLLWALITKQLSISSVGCMTQFYFHFTFGAVENFFLSVMAYDRYVAICNPLRYSAVMSLKTCTVLIFGSWLGGFAIMVIPCLQISVLWFCGPNEIDHYYCDFAPLMKLSCSDTSYIETLVFITACFVIGGCFVLITLSYVCIIRTIITFTAVSGRRKAFSTCASHLIVVLLFYGSTSFMFLRPKTGHSLQVNKIISIFPSIVTPLLNPLIYTLRNQEVKKVVKKRIQKLKNITQRKEMFCIAPMCNVPVEMAGNRTTKLK